jgi:hypothetical protein
VTAAVSLKRFSEGSGQNAAVVKTDPKFPIDHGIERGNHLSGGGGAHPRPRISRIHKRA